MTDATPDTDRPSASVPSAVDIGAAAGGRPRLAEVLPALRQGGLRLLSAGLLPIVSFYIGYRMFGPVVGIILGMAVSLTVLSIQAYRIRRLDPIVLVPMLLILIQGTVASVTGSVELYLAAPAVEAIIWGVVLIGSTVFKRPLVPLIARELGVVPSRFLTSAGLQQSMEVLTIAWGIAAFAKAGLRLWLLTWLPVEPFLIAVTVGIGAINVVMVAISVGLPLLMVRREPSHTAA